MLHTVPSNPKSFANIYREGHQSTQDNFQDKEIIWKENNMAFNILQFHQFNNCITKWRLGARGIQELPLLVASS